MLLLFCCISKVVRGSHHFSRTGVKEQPHLQPQLQPIVPPTSGPAAVPPLANSAAAAATLQVSSAAPPGGSAEVKPLLSEGQEAKAAIAPEPEAHKQEAKPQPTPAAAAAHTQTTPVPSPAVSTPASASAAAAGSFGAQSVVGAEVLLRIQRAGRQSSADSAAPVKWALECFSNMVPLYQSCYHPRFPGLQLSFPPNREAQLKRMYSVVFALDHQLKRHHEQNGDSSEEPPLLPYYVCSASNGDVALATLLADTRSLMPAAPAEDQSSQLLGQLRSASRDPLTGEASEISSVQSTHDDSAEPLPARHQADALAAFRLQLQTCAVAPEDLDSGRGGQLSPQIEGQKIARLQQANVEVLCVASRPNFDRSDRNWLSGLVLADQQLQWRCSPDATSASMFPRVGSNLPASVSLLHWDNSAESSPPFHALDRGFEPLIPARQLFRRCVGPSHPMFSGQVSAWIPFVDELECDHFAVPYYVGSIDWQWSDVNYAPVSGSTWLKDPGSHPSCTIRAGSVVKFRETLESGAELESYGIVSLVFVRLSTSATKAWRNLATQALSDRRMPGAVTKVNAFATEHPFTPVVCLNIIRLRTSPDGRNCGAALYHPDANCKLASDPPETCSWGVAVGNVMEVVVPSLSHQLWTIDTTSTAQHVDKLVKPRSKQQQQQQPRTVDVSIYSNRLTEHLQLFEPRLLEWVRSTVQTIRTAAAGTSGRSAVSFYNDIIMGAHDSCDITRVMAARSSLVPAQVVPDNPRSIWYGEHADATHAALSIPLVSAASLMPVTCAAVTPPSDVSAGAAHAAAARPARRATSGTASTKRAPAAAAVDAHATADSSGAVPSGQPKRAKLSHEEVAGSQVTAVAALFEQLSAHDLPEVDQPFAARVWRITGINQRKLNGNKLAAALAAARKAVLELMRKEQTTMYEQLAKWVKSKTPIAVVIKLLRTRRFNNRGELKTGNAPALPVSGLFEWADFSQSIPPQEKQDPSRRSMQMSVQERYEADAAHAAAVAKALSAAKGKAAVPRTKPAAAAAAPVPSAAEQAAMAQVAEMQKKLQEMQQHAEKQEQLRLQMEADLQAKAAATARAEKKTAVKSDAASAATARGKKGAAVAGAAASAAAVGDCRAERAAKRRVAEDAAAPPPPAAKKRRSAGSTSARSRRGAGSGGESGEEDGEESEEETTPRGAPSARKKQKLGKAKTKESSRSAQRAPVEETAMEAAVPVAAASAAASSVDEARMLKIEERLNSFGSELTAVKATTTQGFTLLQENTNTMFDAITTRFIQGSEKLQSAIESRLSKFMAIEQENNYYTGNRQLPQLAIAPHPMQQRMQGFSQDWHMHAQHYQPQYQQQQPMLMAPGMQFGHGSYNSMGQQQQQQAPLSHSASGSRKRQSATVDCLSEDQEPEGQRVPLRLRQMF